MYKLPSQFDPRPANVTAAAGGGSCCCSCCVITAFVVAPILTAILFYRITPAQPLAKKPKTQSELLDRCRQGSTHSRLPTVVLGFFSPILALHIGFAVAITEPVTAIPFAGLASFAFVYALMYSLPYGNAGRSKLTGFVVGLIVGAVFALAGYIELRAWFR